MLTLRQGGASLLAKGDQQVSSIPDCQCKFLQVTLANEALAYQWDKQGTYQLSEAINGKPSWISGAQAIWYNPEFKDWMIGALPGNGTNFRGITCADNVEHECPQQVRKDHWEYYNGSDVPKSYSNDVSIQCTGKKEQNQRNH